MDWLYNTLVKLRKYIFVPCDILIWGISYYFSYAWLRNTFQLKGFELEFLKTFILYLVCNVAVFFIFKIYKKMWQYADLVEFLYIGISCFTANALFALITVFLGMPLGIRTYVFTTLMGTFFTLVFRFIYSIDKTISGTTTPKADRAKRLLIIGGGSVCAAILRELKRNRANEYSPIAIVDDDLTKLNRSIQGVPIMGTTEEIPKLVKEHNIDSILFAIANIGQAEKSYILNLATSVCEEVNIIPDLYKTLTGQNVPINTIRKVEIEDLLGREPITLNLKDAAKYITNRVIMVTGGGGSIGSELCRQIIKYGAKKLIIVDIYENNAYDIQQELLREHAGEDIDLEVEIASIRDRDKMDVLFNKYRPEVVFHAAAHKHVPLMETTPEEAVKNNVFGTLNLVTMADKYKVKRFVQISTDKAVNPTNIMGATKRICEMIIQTMNERSETEFVAVRFGNVLGSNGSVIPLFKRQIKKGGPVTVTHPNIIRYFMTIPEAVSLVLTAGSLAKGGEIFVLDMGEPVAIRTLAENLIRLSGFKPYEDIQIVYTGLRPGEKLYEELLMDEEGMKETSNKKIFIGHPIDLDAEKFYGQLDVLKGIAYENNGQKVLDYVKEIVPTFNHQTNK